ncbi:MAG: RNA-binding protein [Gammaproteobacteria bacterium]|nr:RNA-binding protein [Gammaproteobacteria bacterium]MDH5727664.1 RNA-binding protein [Gammaproteobacteria bacterium]
MDIYVGNLAYSLTEDELRNAFAEFGEVANVKIVMDKFSGRSKGFGFVDMPNSDEANQAIKSLDGQDVGGRNLKVNEAKPRTERPNRPSR